MMQKTKLAKAIALAVTGVALTVGASSANATATTMYNTFTTTVSTATDGWTRVNDIPTVSGVAPNQVTTPADGIFTGPESKGNSGTLVPWLGTAGGALPFNYAGSSHLNWAVQLGAQGDSATISSADALTRYGTAAEIDTGGGAWNDNGTDALGVLTATGPTGWRHQTDIGIIQSDVSQFVTLNLSTISGTFSRFGVTVFDGIDTGTANYSHHGSWNAPGATPAKPFSASNPFSTVGLTNIGFSDNVDSVNGYSFLAEAGKQYSIYLGGVGFSRWNAGVDGYALSVNTSPVPIPGAVWLFGTALAGFVGLRRRKTA